jgi:hypothetical protein
MNGAAFTPFTTAQQVAANPGIDGSKRLKLAQEAPASNAMGGRLNER